MNLPKKILTTFILGGAFGASTPSFAATPEAVAALFWQALPEQIKPVDKFISAADQQPWAVILNYRDPDGVSQTPDYRAEISVSDSPINAEGLPMVLENQARVDVLSTYTKIRIGGKYDAVTSTPKGPRQSVRFVYFAAPGRTGERRYVVTIRFEGGGAGDVAHFDAWVTAALDGLPLAALAKLQ